MGAALSSDPPGSPIGAAVPIVAVIEGYDQGADTAELAWRLLSGFPVVIRRAAVERYGRAAVDPAAEAAPSSSNNSGSSNSAPPPLPSPLQWTRATFRAVHDEVLANAGSVAQAFCSFGGRSTADAPGAVCPGAAAGAAPSLAEFLSTANAGGEFGRGSAGGGCGGGVGGGASNGGSLPNEFYVGFTVNDCRAAAAISRACVPELPRALQRYFRVDRTPWVFWGRARAGRPVAGAQWHTDRLGASASFHLQAHGRKGWGFKRVASQRGRLRRVAETLGLLAEEVQTVVCGPGDVVVFANDVVPHATWLPPPSPPSSPRPPRSQLDGGGAASADDGDAGDSVSVEFQLHRIRRSPPELADGRPTGS